jgi:excisionase family DNA binding protein
MSDLPNLAALAPAYPVRDAFKLLRVSEPTGYKLIRSGELASYTIGVRRYVTGEAIARFLAARQPAAIDIATSQTKSVAGRLGAAKRNGMEAA